MREELVSILLEWRRTNPYGETKRVQTRPEIQLDGTQEFTIILTISMKVRLENLFKQVEETIWFPTYGQSHTSLSNPEGDIKSFEMFERILTNKFYNAIDKVAKEFSQEITPDGFLDL